jgi:RNA polymerase sigma factor (sigma-70 family)
MSQPARDPAPSLDDLVRRAGRDREALGQLYDIYYDRIASYCLCRVRPRQAAEYICADVFLYVARANRGFRGATDDDFRRWVYRIATTEINAYIRRTRRRQEIFRKIAAHRDVSPPSAGQCDSLHEMDMDEVYQAVSRLRVRDQTIVTLRFLEEMTHEEIGRIVRMRPGSVRVALSRALERLRKQLSLANDESRTRRPWP